MLLEHDADGVQYSPGARLGEAIAEWESLRKDLDDHHGDDNLLIDLFRSGRFEECRTLAAELTPTVARVALQVAATAAIEGLDKALTISLGYDDEVRRQILAQASELTVQARRYDMAGELLAAAVRGAAHATDVLTRVSALRKTRRFEELSFDAADPKGFFFRLAKSIVFDEREGIEPFHSLAEDGGLPVAELEEYLEKWRFMLCEAWRDTTVEAGFDLFVAFTNLVVDGDGDLGYKLRVDSDDVLYLAPEEDGLRLVAMQSLGGAAPIGKQVLRYLEAGNEDAARRWLDWAREGARLPAVEDPLSGDPIVDFWKRGSPAGTDEIRLAALSLIANGPESRSVLAELSERASAGESEQGRRRFEHAALRAAVGAKLYDAAASRARAILASEPESNVAFQFLALCLGELGNWDELEATARERLRLRPDDPVSLRILADAEEARGDFERAAAALRMLVRAGKAESFDYNNLAWLEVLQGEALEEALADAQRAVQLENQTDAASLHTLATVYAEMGEPEAAREVILQAMTVNGSREPQPHDWYVLGRIAEHYGLADAAAEAYRKVEPPEDEHRRASSTFSLAERRLASLSTSPQ